MAPSADRPRPSTDAPAVPPRIGPYRPSRKLGAGGMGVVYLADDEAHGRQIALKVLKRTDQTPETLVKRFLGEGEAAGRLRHPNIVAVYDTGEADGYLYLALEYINGPDLDRLVRKKGPIPTERSLAIIWQVAAALTHAHAAGIVHRDIKPSNILLRKDGTAALTDLGLARAIDEVASAGITRAGYTVGTVDYMPPEQARSSRAADARSDLYSLGCTWHHMLTGKAPFPDGDLTNKLRAHAQSPPPDPRDFGADVPPGVVAVLQRLMAKKPEERYQSATELLTDLERPGLTRRTVTSDDLRALAEDDGDGLVLHDETQAGGVAGGSTAEAAVDAVASRIPDNSAVAFATLAGSSPNVPARVSPKPQPSRPPRPKRADGRDKPGDGSADRIRLAVFLGLIAAALIAVLWVVSQLDLWLTPTVPPPSHGATAPSPSPIR